MATPWRTTPESVYCVRSGVPLSIGQHSALTDTVCREYVQVRHLNWLDIELNPVYVRLAWERLKARQPAEGAS
jgi:hypothetical protein